MAGQMNEIGEIRQAMVDLEDQLRQSIKNIDGQLKSVVADVQKNMVMMFESMQEISDRLPAKSTPNPESSLVGHAPVADPLVVELTAKINKLEESILKTERMGRGEIDMDHLSLFPNAKLPEKFKGMDFTKFDGTIDPKAHLLGYVGSLSMRGVEKDAMAQLFHESLTGPALQWFLSLAPSKKKTWEDIGMAFVSQYDFNVELKMTTRELENTKMGENESFADYVKRWRAKAAQMHNKPDLKEQIRIITKNLPSAFAPYMVLSQSSPDFETFYDSGLAVEEALKDGTLEKKEGKGLHPDNGEVLFGNNDTFHIRNSSNAKPLEINQISDKPTRTFTQFSTPLSTLYEQLLKAGLIKPLLPTPLPKQLPAYHDPNAFCAFHQMPGHVTDKCHRLRHKIQDLIDNETILPPPKESSTLSNHHINTSSTIFDPTHYIIPAHLPKPIVPIPDESSISVLEFEPTTGQTELEELRKAVDEMGQKMDAQMIQIGALTQKMDSLLAFLISDPNLKQNAKEDMDEGRSPPKMKLSEMFKGLAEASEACNTSKDSGTTMSPQLNRSAKSRTFSRFSAPQSMVYGELLKAGLIKPLPPAPLPQKLSTSHNPGTFCIFHQMPGHNTNDCIRLRHAIQDLIDKKVIKAPPQPKPDPVPKRNPCNAAFFSKEE